MYFTEPNVLSVCFLCECACVCMITLPDVVWFPALFPIRGSSEALRTSDVNATLSRCCHLSDIHIKPSVHIQIDTHTLYSNVKNTCCFFSHAALQKAIPTQGSAPRPAGADQRVSDGLPFPVTCILVYLSECLEWPFIAKKKTNPFASPLECCSAAAAERNDRRISTWCREQNKAIRRPPALQNPFDSIKMT